MSTDRQIAVSGSWALASDGLQWMLMRRKGPDEWRSVSFVRSTGSAMFVLRGDKRCR
jgi:hypothetical protein